MVFLESHVYHLKLLLMNKNVMAKGGEGFLEEEYREIYRKYQKYKDAYIGCKTKLEKQNAYLINDRKFTEGILKNCRKIVSVECTQRESL